MSTEGWQSLSVSSVPLSRPISLSDELAFEDKGHFWGGLLVAMIPEALQYFLFSLLVIVGKIKI